MARVEQNSAAPLVPSIAVDGGWLGLLQTQDWSVLEGALPGYLQGRRWFGGKARSISSVRVRGSVPAPHETSVTPIILVQVTYVEGAAETYALPLAFVTSEGSHQMPRETPNEAIVRLDAGTESGIIYDALADPRFRAVLLDAIAMERRWQGADGELQASATSAFQRLRGDDNIALPSRIMRAEQSNTSVVYGDRLILKLFRRSEGGTNPDLEIGRFLTDQVAFGNIPPVAGAIEYRPHSGEPMTLAVLQGFVPNQGDAWQHTLNALDDYYKEAGAPKHDTEEQEPLSTAALLQLTDHDILGPARATLGDYADSARLLGQRTAELHLALAGDAIDPAFAPEPFTLEYQRTTYQSLSVLARQVFATLRAAVDQLPAELQQDARSVLEREDDILARFAPVRERPISAMRTRYHGDYHLGQVLYTGDDFFLIDFEGEPARPLRERRMKRSPLQDVAGMLRSFHYAAYAALLGQGARPAVSPDEYTRLVPRARAWQRWASAAFVSGYLAAAADAPFIPRDREELQLLLDIYVLEKAVYELGYELNNRPTWVSIPAQGILQLLGE